MGIHDRDWYRDELAAREAASKSARSRQIERGPFRVRPTKPPTDWGGFFVRLGAWLLVFASVYSIFWGLTHKPVKRSDLPPTVPAGASFPTVPAPAGSMPTAPENPKRYRYSV